MSEIVELLPIESDVDFSTEDGEITADAPFILGALLTSDPLLD